MNNKFLTSLGCLALLATAIAPTVLGHDDGANDPGTPVAAGVSGVYVGAAGPAIVPGGHAAPESTLSAGFMFCDMEVLGPGTAGGAQEDEITVDGSTAWAGTFQDASVGPPVPGPVAGVNRGFDDGGFGGACHTTHYAGVSNPYNTAGCPDDSAYADDAASPDTWIAASCDFETVTGGTPQSTIFTTCVINGALTQNVATITACVAAFIVCVGAPATCSSGGTRTCGSDAIADGVNYGHGSAGVAYPYSSAQQGTAWEDAIDDESVTDIDCTQADATAAVFVFDAVVVDGASSDVHVATTGQIWQQI